MNVDKALNDLMSVWNLDVMDAQEKARQRYKGKFHNIEEANASFENRVSTIFYKCLQSAGLIKISTCHLTLQAMMSHIKQQAHGLQVLLQNND